MDGARVRTDGNDACAIADGHAVREVTATADFLHCPQHRARQRQDPDASYSAHRGRVRWVLRTPREDGANTLRVGGQIKRQVIHLFIGLLETN